MATIKKPGPHFPLRVLMPKPFDKLQKWLEVWDIKKLRPELTTDEVAVEAGIASPGDRRGSQLRVGSYLRIARQLIDNAAVGKFAEYENH